MKTVENFLCTACSKVSDAQDFKIIKEAKTAYELLSDSYYFHKPFDIPYGLVEIQCEHCGHSTTFPFTSEYYTKQNT